MPAEVDQSTTPDGVGAAPRRRSPRGGRSRLSLSGAIVWFAFSYGGAVLGYLAVNAFAARLLGDDFGYFVVAITVSTVLGQLALVGVHRGGLREAVRLEPGDREGLRDLRGGVRAVSLVTLPLTSLATTIVVFVLLDDSEPASRWAISGAMGMLVWFGGQQKLWANYLRGFGQIRFASMLEGRSGGVLVSIGQGLLVGAVLLLYPSWGLGGALAALALGYAVPVWVAWRRVARQWRHVGGSRSVLTDLSMAVRRHWRFASNLLGGYLNSTVEIWLAALVLTTLDVSLFSAAQRLSILLAIPLVSLGVVFSPVVARLYGTDDARLEKVMRTGATAALVVSALVWVPMLVAPEPLLAAVYGDQFRAAAPILILLTLGSVVNVLTGLCGTALTMSRFEGAMSTVQWCAVAARISIGTLAALTLGAEGLAASAAAITAALYITLWILARTRMGLRTHLTLRPSLRLLRGTSG